MSPQCRFYSVDFKLPFAKVCLRFEHVAKLKLKDFQGPAGRMNEEEFQGFKRTPKFNGFKKFQDAFEPYTRFNLEFVEITSAHRIDL